MSPGTVKHEGTQTVLCGAHVQQQLNVDGRIANLARYIKNGEITVKDSGDEGTETMADVGEELEQAVENARRPYGA